MKKKTLLDVMEHIDDIFITEAAHPEILLKSKRKARMLSVSKMGTLAACMVIAVGMLIAVPYMRATGKNEEMDADYMNSAIQSAIDAANQAQAAKDAALASSIAADKVAQAEQDAAIASSVAADKAAQEEELKKAQEAAAAASKVAAEASKAAAEASKQASKSTGISSSAASTVTETAFSQLETENQKYVFAGYDHILYDLVIFDHIQLVDLVIPETISGNPIIEISDHFWSICAARPELKTISIPDTIEKFGNANILGKNIVIICSADSPAAAFFTKAGYTVQTTP